MGYPILMYHGVRSDVHPCRYDNPSEYEWVVNVEIFRRQMAILADLGFQSVLLKEIDTPKAGVGLPPRPVVLTFDDGHETCHLNALPVLAEFGFRAEFFVTSAWIDQKNYMTRAQIIDMHRHGMSLQSHGRTHRFLNTLGDEDLREELQASRRVISAITGEDVRFIAYPGGRHDDRVERFVREAGYTGSCTSLRGYNDPAAPDLFRLRRLGVTKDTGDREFRAMISDDRIYFARRWLRSGMIQTIRRCIGPRRFESIRSRWGGAGGGGA